MLPPFLGGPEREVSMRSSRAAFLSFALALALAPAALAATTDPVRVEQGLVSGTAGKNPDVRVYKGIPFAAPPVGDLRWKAPQPPASWQGVRQATEFAHPCMQLPYPESSAYYSKLPPLSEDCLYLNIWTAAKTARDKLPVMVWIHGGGFTRGAGSTPTYDGENFAGKGVVLVTVNYRLGVFGFLALPELSAESAHHSSGMYGMLDQVAALEWIRKNIAKFGGDPKRVTIFGESAGSLAVNFLMASPLAKGLFHRAIAESGGSFGPMRTLAEAEKSGTAFAASLGAEKDTLKTLRAKTSEEVLKAGAEQTGRPPVDGWFLPQDVYSIFAQGKQNDVPLIVGSNADEGTTLAPQGANTKAVQFTQEARQRYGSQADQYLKLYPASSDQEAVASFYASFRNNMAWGMHTWARMQTKTGHHAAYRYYFTRRPPGPLSQQQRAYHASEIAYVFQNFLGQRPWEDADRKLGATMASYWVNFAITGNPNGKGLAEWPAYGADKEKVMELGDTVNAEPLLYEAEMDLFDQYYNSQRQPEQAARSGNR
jgi:para-nitrobenzyl esterase